MAWFMSCALRPHFIQVILANLKFSRGKKIFRRFEDDVDMSLDEDGDSNDDGHTLTSPRRRPFTRSSIKPRLLFPTEGQKREREQVPQQGGELAVDEDVDDEAMTEIDESLLNPPNEIPKDTSSRTTRNSKPAEARNPAPPITPTTPTHQGPPITPTSPSFHTTTRTTRSSTRKAAVIHDTSPFEPEHDRPVSPGLAGGRNRTSQFAGWKRTKSAMTVAGKGKKRGPETTEKVDGETNKKAKI